MEVERLQVDEIDAPATHHRNTGSSGDATTRYAGGSLCVG